MKYFLILFILININCKAQDSSKALLLVKKYFNNELPDYKSILGKEAYRQDINPDSIKVENIEFEVLEEDEFNSAISVTLKKNKDSVGNIYVFLVKENDWKIDAFRSLSLPGIYFNFLDKYKGMEIDDLKYTYSKNVELARIIFDSLKLVKNTDSISSEIDTIKFEDYIKTYYTENSFLSLILSMRLTLSSDENLIEHFNKNKIGFDRLQVILSRDSIFRKEEWRLKDDSGYSDDFYELSIAQVYKESGENFLRFLVGGILENTVGYLYCKELKDLPKLSKNNFIMLKKICENWYIYKTT